MRYPLSLLFCLLLLTSCTSNNNTHKSQAIKPLKITINSPAPNATVTNKALKISGLVNKSSHNLKLTIAGMPTGINADGTFSRVLPLSLGMNEIEALIYDTYAKKTIARNSIAVA